MVELAVGAIVQGLVVSLVVVGLLLTYMRYIAKVGRNLDDISQSLTDIENAVKEVDLKRMEESLIRVDYAITETDSGTESVKTHLEKSGIDVIISYKGIKEIPEGEVNTLLESDLVTGLHDMEEDEPAERIRINLSFEEDIEAEYVKHELTSDEEIAELEIELLDAEPLIQVKSPRQWEVDIPISSRENIAEWIEEFIRLIDEKNAEFREKQREFDKEISDHIENSDII